MDVNLKMGTSTDKLQVVKGCCIRLRNRRHLPPYPVPSQASRFYCRLRPSRSVVELRQGRRDASLGSLWKIYKRNRIPPTMIPQPVYASLL